MAKEKADYEGKKAGERKVKKEVWVAPTKEVKDTVWAEAQEVVDQKVVDKQKKDNECILCGMNNHTWKFCRKPVQVSAVYGEPAKPKRQASFAPKGCPQVATRAVDSQGEGSRPVAQRPQA